MLQQLGVDDIKAIAELSKQAREAQDLLLDKMRVVDRFEDGKLIEAEAIATLDSLEVSLDNEPLEALKQRVGSLASGARLELMAVMWIGRGDFGAAEWDDAVLQAASTADASVVDYITEQAALHEYLAKGLYQLKLA
jgi:hypothetical protein